MKIISVDNISKKFVLARGREKGLLGALRGAFSRASQEDFWALKNVSFDIQQGQAVGIIGHNGAGKSTMLKLLTGIMHPTTGRIRTRGRVSALIEVGAGFHPEMTGRENIYLSGAILGMSRKEIDRKFGAIVDFAELEKFIDVPVKRYSSGMYARLGFSVAAHVDPEILIVDEVLSVGDSAFQEKCTRTMCRLKESNTTVVFVSHSMGAITSLCDRVILLSKGRVECDSNPAEAIRRSRELALRSTMQDSQKGSGNMRSGGQGLFTIIGLECLSDPAWVVAPGGQLTMRVYYNAGESVMNPRIGLRFRNAFGAVVARVNLGDVGLARDVCGDGYVDVEIDHFPLLPERYWVHGYAFNAVGAALLDEMTEGQELSVTQPDAAITDVRPGPEQGYVWLEADWSWPGIGSGVSRGPDWKHEQ